jgi:hypothetical protein
LAQNTVEHFGKISPKTAGGAGAGGGIFNTSIGISEKRGSASFPYVIEIGPAWPRTPRKNTLQKQKKPALGGPQSGSFGREEVQTVMSSMYHFSTFLWVSVTELMQHPSTTRPLNFFSQFPNRDESNPPRPLKSEMKPFRSGCCGSHPEPVLLSSIPSLMICQHSGDVQVFQDNDASRTDNVRGGFVQAILAQIGYA